MYQVINAITGLAQDVQDRKGGFSDPELWHWEVFLGGDVCSAEICYTPALSQVNVMDVGDAEEEKHGPALQSLWVRAETEG